jgi:hypothetical protein
LSHPEEREAGLRIIAHLTRRSIGFLRCSVLATQAMDLALLV